LSFVAMNKKKLEKIEFEILNCRRCSLHTIRNKTVPGVFAAKTQIAFVGDAPGIEDDKVGLPFAAKYGRRLHNLCRDVNIPKSDYSLLYCVKCLPMMGGVVSKPKRETAFFCAEYLYSQLETVEPNLIVTVG